ncbi:MAG: haloacid dehalogenase type II [Labedaea sp.]
MAELDVGRIKVLAFDIFGTTVDWWTGVARQVEQVAAERGVELDGGAVAADWRGRYVPSMDLVRRAELPWCNLDVLHRRSLDELLAQRDVGAAFDEGARAELVRAWHRLPAWPDSAAGLARLRGRYTVAAVSNGGFALLTNLVKAAELPFDCIVSAELARHYKPDPEAYLSVAALLDVEPAEVLMVAAHVWDLDGARRAGLRTAFVERPLEKGPGARADRAGEFDADVSASSFTELADRLRC